MPYGLSDRGDRLFAARKALGFSQEVFAERCDTSRLMVMGLEKKGATESTSVGTYMRLAAGFSVDVETLERYLSGKLLTEEFVAISAARTAKLLAPAGRDEAKPRGAAVSDDIRSPELSGIADNAASKMRPDGPPKGGPTDKKRK
jgi:transcriptional regulator with XRE-family HTH domain